MLEAAADKEWATLISIPTEIEHVTAAAVEEDTEVSHPNDFVNRHLSTTWWMIVTICCIVITWTQMYHTQVRP